jgi:hypothetical protein
MFIKRNVRGTLVRVSAADGVEKFVFASDVEVLERVFSPSSAQDKPFCRGNSFRQPVNWLVGQGACVPRSTA